MRSRRTIRLSLAATAVAAVVTVFPLATALASASPAVHAASGQVPGEVIIPTAPPEPTEPPVPEPTEEPPVPEPTEEPPVPEPTEEPPVPEPSDEAPVPVPVPAVPAEPATPVEVTTEEPEDFFVDDDDTDEVPVEEAPAPVVTPTPTPTPSATPIPAIDIFAPFYPASSGPVRDLMPLILGGAAAAIMVLAAIASFIVSRFRLARLRAMTAVSFRPSGPSSPLAPRVSGKTPRNLDISVLIAASPQPVKVPAERLFDWQAGPRAVSPGAQPAASSLSLNLPVRSTTPTGAKRAAADFSVPSLGEPRPAGRRRREGAAGSASRFTLAGLLSPRAPKVVDTRFDVEALAGASGTSSRPERIPVFAMPFPRRTSTVTPR